MSHDSRHHVVYDCDGEQHAKVFETLRTAGVELVEAGPASTYARDIQVRQRWADAGQFAKAKDEVHRLRAAIVDTLRTGDLDHVREGLEHAERLDWDWFAPAPQTPKQEVGDEK